MFSGSLLIPECDIARLSQLEMIVTVREAQKNPSFVEIMLEEA